MRITFSGKPHQTKKTVAKLTAMLLFSLTTKSYAEVPSHCNANEVAILDAWMTPAKTTKENKRPTKNDKVVSLCADRKTEPYATLNYRYGRPGQVELDQSATLKEPFFLYSARTSPNSVLDIVYFKKANISYYLAIAGGQAYGVDLYVYEENRLLLHRFSGTREAEDFNLGPAEPDFTEAKSPMIRIKKPIHQPWYAR